ncbi:MAG: DUF4197 domain-containing protein [Flavobacteriales bacterium]|nr:DUF4197 domain-containing protein [Flavobacteriales bacterium]
MNTKHLILFAAIVGFTSCTELENTLNTANQVMGNGSTEKKLTNEEVIRGLREALSVGTNNSSSSASKADGFLKNPLIFIPFPPDAIKVKEKVEAVGMKNQVDKFVETMNHGAEEACKESAPIFLNAITSMSIGDGFNILNGPDNAATQYLQDKTSNELYATFKPKVQNALKTVKLTDYWNPLITKYNQLTALTGGEKINPDLDDYVTKGAMKGLFTLIADEEKKIRKDPMARVSDILKTVFGSLDNK